MASLIAADTNKQRSLSGESWDRRPVPKNASPRMTFGFAGLQKQAAQEFVGNDRRLVRMDQLIEFGGDKKRRPGVDLIGDRYRPGTRTRTRYKDVEAVMKRLR